MKSRKRLAVSIGVVAIALLVTVVTLTLIPVRRHFEMSNVWVRDAESTCSGIVTTKGTTITFQWSDPRAVEFGVWACSSHLVYEGNGTSGNGTLASIGGTYEFGTICGPGNCHPANVSGDYTGPLLVL